MSKNPEVEVTEAQKWVADLINSNPKADEVDLSLLTEVGARPKLFEYFSGLWERRHFIKAQSRAKAFGSIKDTALGRIWLVLEPFLSSAVYWFIFAVLMSADRGVENFIAYLITGVIMFGFLLKHLNGAANLISSEKGLIKAFSFPRAAVVLSFVRRNVIDFIPQIIALLIFIVAMPPHVAPSLTWLLFIPVFVLAIFFATGLAFLTATLTTVFKDLKFVWPLLTRFWFYGSGVFWSVDMFADKEPLPQIMMANPGWQFLELCRETLVYGSLPPSSLWLTFSAWAFGTFVIGSLVFWANEEKYGAQDA